LEVNKTGATVYTDDIDINSNLTIYNGTFDTNGNTVDVQNNLHNYATITVDDSLRIGNDLFLYSGSVVDLTGTIQLGTLDGEHGSAIHYNGSTFNQTGGNYLVESIRLNNGSQFNGTGGITWLQVSGFSTDNTIEIDDPDSYFYRFAASATNAELHDCDYDLEVTDVLQLWSPFDVNSYEINAKYINIYNELIIDSGGIVNTTNSNAYFRSGSTLTMVYGSELNSALGIRFYAGSTENVSGGEIYLEGDFVNESSIFTPTGGSVTFDGTSPSTIIGTTAFYDLTINKSGAIVSSNSPFGMLHDLLINSGVLDPGDNIIEVYGDWTNNVGDAGFIEGTQQVYFMGSNSSIINTDETFYDLIVDNTNPSFNGVTLATGTTINVLDDLNIFDGTLEMDNNSTLNVLDNVSITEGAGLNAYIDTGLEINIGGNWDNNNITWDIGLGYATGTEVITFNGSGDQYLYTEAPEEDFGNLVIDKPGGYFRPDGNIRVRHDLDILDGIWYDEITSLTHYFEGDFYISDGSNSSINNQRNNTIVFKGTNDQTVYFNPDDGWVNSVVIDKTAWSTRNFNDLEGVESTTNRTNLFEDITESRSQKVLLLSSLDSDELIIEEGTFDVNGNTLYVWGDVYVNDGGSLIVDENAELQVQDGYDLEVNSGGTIEILGIPGNLATVTNRGSGYYNFNINSGATISAEYGLFEYMSDNGVYVWAGANVDPAHSFNYCTFQNGSTNYGSTFLHLNNFTDITITGANFPDAASTTYNVAKTVNPPSSPGTITMDNCIGIFSGAAFEFDIFNRIDWTGLPEINNLTIQYNDGTDEIELIWTYPQSVDHFNVYRSTDPYDFSGATVFTTPYTSSEMEYSEPATGTQYFYRVTADNGSAEISGKH